MWTIVATNPNPVLASARTVLEPVDLYLCLDFSLHRLNLMANTTIAESTWMVAMEHRGINWRPEFQSENNHSLH